MSVLGACWRRPILGENQGNFEDFKTTPKIGEHAGNRGKAAPEIEENQHREKKLQSGQTVAEQLESGQAPTWRTVGSRTNQD
jgi:hypothetical protein